jgi:hypothetical protein
VVEVKAENKVAYQLPYPGILPDHPLYFLKALRDRLHLFFNRSLQKKQKFIFFILIKGPSQPKFFFKKEKKMALDALVKGEKYFLEISFVME